MRSPSAEHRCRAGAHSVSARRPRPLAPADKLNTLLRDHKEELINDPGWPTQAGLHCAVFDYIEG